MLVETARLPCEALVDGRTIDVGESDYEPDVIIRREVDAVSDDSLVVPDPVQAFHHRRAGQTDKGVDGGRGRVGLA